MRIEKKFAKLKRCDHSPKREEFIDVSLDPLYFSLDSPFNRNEHKHDASKLKYKKCPYVCLDTLRKKAP